MSTWEIVALCGVAALVFFWIFPNIKATMKRSEEAPKDYMGIAIPLIGVILFVLFLVMSVRGL